MVKIIMLIFMHIIGDSLLLGKKLRQQKIDSVLYLFKHVGIYTLVFLIISPIWLDLTITQTLLFNSVIALQHFIVDFIFIKIKKHFWDTKVYKFVVVYGALEHLIHVVLIIGIYMYLFPDKIDISTWWGDFLNIIQR